MRSCLTLLASIFLSIMSAGPLSAEGKRIFVKEGSPGLLAKAKFSADAAIAAAQAKVPKGKLASVEIEEEKGNLIYSLDFKTERKSGIDEVTVDALTGEVLAVEHESPKAEAKERAADAKHRPKKRN